MDRNRLLFWERQWMTSTRLTGAGLLEELKHVRDKSAQVLSFWGMLPAGVA